MKNFMFTEIANQTANIYFISLNRDWIFLYQLLVTKILKKVMLDETGPGQSKVAGTY